MGRGLRPLPDPSQVGRGIPLPTCNPPRHLDPSHSKILGTPLTHTYTQTEQTRFTRPTEHD